MLRLPLHLDPHGDVTARRTLGTLCIANDGTGTRERGNYRVWLENEDGATVVQTTVTGWPRRRHAWLLALNALQGAVAFAPGDAITNTDAPTALDVMTAMESE